jgi:hypothetical protein
MLPLGRLAPPGVGVATFALAVSNTTLAGAATVRASSSAQVVGSFKGSLVVNPMILVKEFSLGNSY